MADKAVKVRLIADVQNYLQGMKQASEATEETARSAENIEQWGASWSEAASKIGGQMMFIGGAAVAGVGLAVNAYANFDEAMSKVQSATHASAAEMQLLTDAARRAGADTAYSATEAAGAIEELAKAGVETTDILNGGLDGALALAAAGNVDVAFAAETAASAMVQFNLTGKDVTHVADLLAAGAGKAQGGVQELSQALAQSGLIASQMGLSIEETVGGLSAFASAGLMGSDAGTSFKTMLQRLANPSKEAADTMASLGLNAWDAQGNFVGLAEFAGQLKTRMSELTPEARNAAMSILFGTDAVRAANVLFDQGQEGIQGWIDKVNDAGYAAETAAIMQDNLKGDLEKLGGAWDELLIGMGETADGPLRGMVQGLTSLIDAFTNLPGPIKATVTVLGAVGGGLTLAAGAALVLIPRIAETKTALKTLGITSADTKAKLGKLFTWKNIGITAAIAAATVAVDAFNRAVEDGIPTSEQLRNALETTGSAADTLTAALDRTGAAKTFFGGLEDSQKYLENFEATLSRISTGNWFEWMDVTQGEWKFADALQAVGEQLAQLADSDLPRAQTAYRALVEEYNLGSEAQWQLLESMDAYKDKLTALATEQGVNLSAMSETERQAWLVEAAMGDAASGTDSLTDAQRKQAKAAEKAAAANEDLADSIRALDDLMGGLVGAENNFYESIDEVNAALEKNGQNLDVTTEAGRSNRAALRDLAGATTDLAAELTSAGASTDEVVAKMREGRAAFIEAAQAMGLSGDEAAALADQYGLIPARVTTEFTADTSGAVADVITWHRTADGMYAQATLGADISPAQGEVAVWKLQADGTFAVTTMDADTAAADRGVIEWKQLADGTWAVARMGTDAGMAYTATNQWKVMANGTIATARVDADTSMAEAAIWRLAGTTISIGVQAMLKNAIGGMYSYQEYANGGVRSHVPTGIYPGGANILKFAEPETRWEAFVSGKRGEEERNRGILAEAAKRLGMGVYRLQQYADGGIVRHARAAEHRAITSTTVMNNGIPAGSKLVLEVAGQPIEGVVRAIASPIATAAAKSAVSAYDSGATLAAIHGQQRGS